MVQQQRFAGHFANRHAAASLRGPAGALTMDTQSGGTVMTAASADSLASGALPAPSPLPTL